MVLRVHTDPISIIGKILEQNQKSYTKIQDFTNLGRKMVQAGLTGEKGSSHKPASSTSEEGHILATERRITAMCIDAALVEDDFETAFSYVVSRASLSMKPGDDEYLWKAALQAGKYRRTSRTALPTHLGTSSGNLEIRHLEQRIECLSVALRMAPPPTLQEIINAFRRAEEELEAAIKAEEDQEDAWDTAGDTIHGPIPGGFNPTPISLKAAHKQPIPSRSRQVEEAPMSLFDLSKASVMSAQRNLTALSSLQRSTGLGRSNTIASNANTDHTGSDTDEQKRVRKRDQFRDAAMGTLVSGVGWLVGAPTPAPEKD